MLCFILMSLPRSYCRCHSSLPVARSRQTSMISCPPGPRPPAARGRAFFPGTAAGGGGGVAEGSSFEGVLRKILSPHTVGDEPLHAGISTFHLMFLSGAQVSGRFFAPAAVPSPFGPRQPGQSAAPAGRATASASRGTIKGNEGRREGNFIRGREGTREGDAIRGGTRSKTHRGRWRCVRPQNGTQAPSRVQPIRGQPACLGLMRSQHAFGIPRARFLLLPSP